MTAHTGYRQKIISDLIEVQKAADQIDPTLVPSRILLHGPDGLPLNSIAKSLGDSLLEKSLTIGFRELYNTDLTVVLRNLAEIFEGVRNQRNTALILTGWEIISQLYAIQPGGDRLFQSEFLRQLSRTNYHDHRVIVIFATSQPWMVKAAYLSPDAFDRSFFVGPVGYETVKTYVEGYLGFSVSREVVEQLQLLIRPRIETQVARAKRKKFESSTGEADTRSIEEDLHEPSADYSPYFSKVAALGPQYGRVIDEMKAQLLSTIGSKAFRRLWPESEITESFSENARSVEAPEDYLINGSDKTAIKRAFQQADRLSFLWPMPAQKIYRDIHIRSETPEDRLKAMSRILWNCGCDILRAEEDFRKFENALLDFPMHRLSFEWLEPIQNYLKECRYSDPERLFSVLVNAPVLENEIQLVQDLGPIARDDLAFRIVLYWNDEQNPLSSDQLQVLRDKSTRQYDPYQRFVTGVLDARARRSAATLPRD